MADNHNVNARITSTNRRAADEFQYKSFSEDGVLFVVDTNAVTSGYYYGFLVLADAVVASITHVDSTKNGDVTSVTSIPAGVFISQPGGFTTLTLTSGEVMLVKYNPIKV
jgi:hypothetical protein